MAQVQQGRREALAGLYDRYSGRVYGMAMQKLQDPAEAQDVMQDVFVTIWKKATTFQPDRGMVQSWLLTTAHHRIIDRLRRETRTREAMESIVADPLFMESAEQPSPASEAERSEEAGEVRQALLVLPVDQREVIVLGYYHGLSQTEISDRLKLPLGTVKARTRLAMEKLRRFLGPGRPRP